MKKVLICLMAVAIAVIFTANANACLRHCCKDCTPVACKLVKACTPAVATTACTTACTCGKCCVRHTPVRTIIRAEKLRHTCCCKDCVKVCDPVFVPVCSGKCCVKHTPVRTIIRAEKLRHTCCNDCVTCTPVKVCAPVAVAVPVVCTCEYRVRYVRVRHCEVPAVCDSCKPVKADKPTKAVK